MKGPNVVRVKIVLPAELLERVDEVGRSADVPRSHVVAHAVALWAQSGAAVPKNDHPAQELSQKAKQRLAVLEEFKALRSAALANHRDLESVTEQFVSKMLRERGMKVCRSTLYKWRRRLASFGPAGLLDGRRGRFNTHLKERPEMD